MRNLKKKNPRARKSSGENDKSDHNLCDIYHRVNPESARAAIMTIRCGGLIGVQEFRLLFGRNPERVYRGRFVRPEDSAKALALAGGPGVYAAIAANNSPMRRWAQRQVGRNG